MLNQNRDSADTPADHWKNRLEQRTKRLPSSSDFTAKPGTAGSRRLWGARLRLALLASFFAGVMAIAAFAWRDLASEAARPVVAQERIAFKSDGVLSERWVRETLASEDGMPPVFDIKRRLESVAQVRSAEVRRMPDGTLEIRLYERRPVMRTVVRLPDGTTAPRLIAADGVIFDGINIGQLTFANLPVLDGLRHPPRAEANFDVIDGFSRVADFLDMAREKYPAIYRDWLKVSLRDYPGRPDAPGALFRVKPRLMAHSPDSAAIVEIVFSPTNFARELEGLARPEMAETIRQYMRAVDRSKFPAYRLDLSLVNWTDPRNPVPQLHLIPVSVPARQP